MPLIGNMLWRIGELLEFDEQLAWTREAGFDGVGFHASPGVPGQWRGLDPATCDARERKRLRRELAGFAFVEIHAPFAIELRAGNLPAAVAALMPVLQLASDLRAGVVTVHAALPDDAEGHDAAAWCGPMQELDARAAQAQTVIALEITQGFDLVRAWGLPGIGVTLDVGHMYLPTTRPALEGAGGIGALIRRLGTGLVHLHLHDTDGSVDHIETGTGIVDFGALAAALTEIGYRGGMTLELNPSRCGPEGIRRSAAHVRARFAETGRAGGAGPGP